MITITLFSFDVSLDHHEVDGRLVDPQALATAQAKKYLETPVGKWVAENRITIKLYSEANYTNYSRHYTIRGTLSDQQATDFYLRFGSE